MNDPGDLFISALRVPATSEFAMTAWQDAYWVHKLVYRLFPSTNAGTTGRPLFRFDVEGAYGWLYIQSTIEPDWSRHGEPVRKLVVATRPLVLPDGDRLRFRLLARPTFRVGEKESAKLGERVSIEDERGQREWLQRKGETSGFRLEEYLLTSRVWFDSKTNHRLRDGSPKPLLATRFDGVLAVTDPEKLKEAVRNGIGTQKAYGFGLLSLACVE